VPEERRSKVDRVNRARATSVRLRLRSVSFDRVEFELARMTDSGDLERRLVVVLVGAGTTWLDAVWFPATAIGGSDATATTGDDALDRTIRERAAEELVRLEAAVRMRAEGAA
jgi:hypothetical protein